MTETNGDKPVVTQIFGDSTYGDIPTGQPDFRVSMIFLNAKFKLERKENLDKIYYSLHPKEEIFNIKFFN